MDPILIIDDERDNLEALKRLLRNDYAVTCLDSPLEALKLIQKNTYNVIVSDQRMPEMTGVELLEKTKTICPHSTRILLTGYTDIEAVITAINRGNIYRYVAKPWDPDELKITLRQANEACKLKRELEQKNVALSKSNEELKKALTELEVLDKTKTRFLSLVSHELNTPLTVLTSFVDLILDKQEKLPEEIKRAHISIAKASERFRVIISEVLTFVKIESNQKIHRELFNLEKASLEIINSLEEERRKRKISFTCNTISKPVIQADKEQTKTALVYFLRDAVNRSREKENIKINISKKTGEMIFSLTRGGEKVSSDIFNPFETGENVLHHGQNLGLSLAICRLIVERHGGKMILVSSSEQKTTIEIHFPCAEKL